MKATFYLPPNSELIKNKRTSDYGIFKFNFVDEKKLIAKIISKEIVPLNKFDIEISKGIDAKEANCK